MSDDSTALERAVARFVVSFGSDQIDANARANVKRLIKDQLANQVGASQLPWSKQIKAFRRARPGKSTIVADTVRASAVDAAYINAAYGHGFEYDDFAGNGHPGCCVVPAAIAIGEELGATLEQVVVALLVGYETYVRIGYPASPALLNIGWQPHCVLANFGAAAIAAKLHGFDEERTSHALAIALSHASGTTEYASTGGSIKRAHAGIAVRNGIESAYLAEAGITGPRRFLNGDRGFYRMFAQKSVGAEAIRMFQPGEPLQILDMKFKPYCCCACTHPFIEVMQQVQGRAAEIVSVDAKMQTMVDAIVGNRNAHAYNPRNIEELQYSLVVQMAMAALGIGNGYKPHRDYLEGKLSLAPDSEVIKLTSKIKLTIDKELDTKYPRTFAADVTVHYRDGTSQHIFLDRVRGSPAKPFTPEEFQAKLDELTVEVIGAQQSRQLFALLDRLDPATPVGELTKLLVPGK